jgi:hypothetical protein
MRLLGLSEMKRLVSNRLSRNFALTKILEQMPVVLETVIHKSAPHLKRPGLDSVSPVLNEANHHIQQQIEATRVSIPSRLMRAILNSQAHTLPRLRRKLLVCPWRRNALKIARAETRSLMRLLRRSGIPVEKISLAAPALARCLAQRQIMYTNILGITSLLGMILISLPMIIVVLSREQYLSPIITLLIPVNLATFLVGAFVITKGDDDYRRILTFSTGYNRLALKYTWVSLVIMLFTSLLNLKDTVIYRINIYGLAIVSAQSLLTLSYVILVYWVARIILRWRAPELTLVRALADAFEIVLAASPANWRSISLRSKAGRYIHKAAMALEGPIARKFAASAGFSDAVAIQKRFQMAGVALRSKVAWLATPRAETKSFLARALADELLIAATGDLDRLEYSEIGQTQSAVSWGARLRATASWAVFGLGPAIFVVVSRTVGWISDPATTAILVQFAFLCFFVAVLSAADPSGNKERLSSVTGTGAALFGWRKPETKD